MPKIIIVNSCRKCPYIMNDKVGMPISCDCILGPDILEDVDKIPKECPLKDMEV